MKKLITVFAVLVMIITSCTKQASNQLASEEQTRKGGKHSVTVAQVVQSEVTITHNLDGTFTVDYGSIDTSTITWMYFRWGSELWPNGNVNPYSAGSSSQSYYKNPVTTIIPNGSSTYYQLIVHIGFDPGIYSNVTN